MYFYSAELVIVVIPTDMLPPSSDVESQWEVPKGQIDRVALHIAVSPTTIAASLTLPVPPPTLTRGGPR